MLNMSCRLHMHWKSTACGRTVIISRPRSPFTQGLRDTVRIAPFRMTTLEPRGTRVRYQQLDQPNEVAICASEAPEIVIIHPSRLFADCLKGAVSELSDRISYADTPSEASVLLSSEQLALVVVGGDGPIDIALVIDVVAMAGARAPVVVIDTCEDGHRVSSLIGAGARGCIPKCFELPVTLQALRLVLAGGMFVPAEIVMQSIGSEAESSVETEIHEKLTAKQFAVLNGIRRGKPNKTIAYELNMCESTVKVHVRSIMKKLRARNRTHVACMTLNLPASQSETGVDTDPRIASS